FRRTRARAAGFEQTRAVWSLNGAYVAVFDEARNETPGRYTVSTAWRTPLAPRLKDDGRMELEDAAENRFTLRWFPGQPTESALERRKEGAELVLSSAGEFAAGQRWSNINLLLPRRKAAYSAERLGASAIEVRQPDTTEIVAVNAGETLARFGRVATDGSAVLAQWTRKWAGPVRVRYVNASRIEIDTGIEPESVPPLARAQWKFSAGRTVIEIPRGSGEIEIRFADPVRQTVNLNRDWKLLPWDTANGADPAHDDSDWRPVQLPYSELARDNDANVRWYRKTFAAPPEARRKLVFLDFEGVAIQCAVWVNGKKAGEHLDAFNSFRFDITGLVNPPGAANLIAVRVDFAPQWRYRIPFLPEGFNDWGGIYRDVWLTYADPLHVEDVVLTTPGLSAASGAVEVRARVANRGAQPRTARLVSVVYDPGQNEVLRAERALEIPAGGEREVKQTTPPLARPALWSPASPTLYTVITRVVEDGRVVDEVRNPLGFRWFRFDAAEGFFLNGEHLKLHGANMHQGYPYLGNAVPNSKMAADLHVLKAMGCNFLRTTHIPMDPVVLEMADRLGLLVWEEIPVAGFGNGKFGDPVYDESARQQMRDMVRRDRNHPSIIIWSTMNEAAGGAKKEALPPVLKLCRELNDIAKQEDPTRATAAAETVEAFFGVTDVSGRNGYFRGGNLYQLGGALDQLKREHAESRFLISEYGAPNVERGSFGLGRTDTEEYAALAHEVNNREYERRPWIAGSTIWVAFDYFQGNPHEGVTDEARYPKDAYYYYQSQWSGEPMLRIRSASHWQRGSAAQDVAVDSNCDEVELFVNGKSQGALRGPGPFVWRQVAFARGSIRAVGRKGPATLEDSRYTAGEPARVIVSADVDELAADGRDVAYLKARVLDQDGRLVANLNDTVRFEAAGQGEMVGPASQKLLAGVATLASVRSAAGEGEIQVTARYGRLKPATVVIRTTKGKSSVEYE
ncbi:MAG: DUF4982 domain-containing protein, partial [Acidobacteriia bacterium]|nr:DUF4982 domain-containing protein [Terriglobia bacterium]